MTSPTWQPDHTPAIPKPRGLEWIRVVYRGTALVLVLLIGLVTLLGLRLIERPFNGSHRPWSPHVTVAVCRMALRILRLPIDITGRPMAEHGAIVANHSSWLDIFVLNAAAPVYFVSKAEVANWPMIGWLARSTGTVFIRRSRGEAARQTAMFEDRLKVGHRLLFFPEGTSTDGLRVLPFKPTLFAAFFSDALPDISVQPATVIYHAPPGEPAHFYGWWGDMEFGPHLLHLLGTPRQGRVAVIWHAPLKVSDFAGRKALAAEACRTIETAHRTARET